MVIGNFLDKTFFWEGVDTFFLEELNGKGVWVVSFSIFGGRSSGFSEIVITNFISRLLFDLLFMYRLKDVVLFVIFHSKFLASFILLEVFLIVSYFSNSLFKREGV